ncbi:MAG: asparagine synthase (glutamine-hydrolyzing), partial [Acidimicrobiia bacterium]
RGPDDEGFHSSEWASLAHRRLSIIDLDHGHQPMSAKTGDLHLVYNGEVYNFRELRDELSAVGVVFETECDTEVVLHAYATWGKECFKKFNGMWALAILDERGARPELILCRDHYGIKPLYIARTKDRLLFASEIKAILADPDLETSPNEQWIADYLRFGLHDHSTATAFSGITQIAPATVCTITPDGETTETYWEPELSSDGNTSTEEFRERWTTAVQRRLVADVPVGTCLSGGIDSGSIVGTMAELLSDHAKDTASMGDQLKTFSIVYDGDPINEREYMDVSIDAAHPDAHFDQPESKKWIDELDALVWHQDEPIFSSAPYAQWCVMRLAQPHVKVLLNGQAGDELLAGYTPYQMVRLKELLRSRKLGAFLKEATQSRDVLWPLIKRKLANRRKSLDVSTVLHPEFLGRVGQPKIEKTTSDLKKRLVQDLTMWSLPSLLRSEDRNSMAFSMESRLPFLDQEFVDYVLTLPSSAIVNEGWSRKILRDSLVGTLPDKIRLRRWKVGFTTPETRWFRARRATIQGLFRSPLFAARPYWDGPAVADAFTGMLDGKVEPSPFFWRALNVEIWLRVFFADASAKRTRLGAKPERTFTEVGDTTAPVDDARLGDAQGHWGHHLYMDVDGETFLRLPVKTQLVSAGDDLTTVLDSAFANAHSQPGDGDLIAISEKIVAISQGRSQPISEITPRPLARWLSGLVRKTASGIGLGMPETMELALREAGTARILFATFVGAVTRPLGIHGMFYRVAGASVNAIDGPTTGTIPPYDTHAKLPPADPSGVANALAARFSAACGGTVRVAVIDANDIGVNVLGSSTGVDEAHVAALFRDNPLGQAAEQTPVALVRRAS